MCHCSYNCYVSNLLVPKFPAVPFSWSDCGQVVHIHIPLSLNIIICYWSEAETWTGNCRSSVSNGRWVKTHLMVSMSVVSKVCISMTSESFIVRLKPHEFRSNVMQFSNLCFCSTSVTQHGLMLHWLIIT